MSTNTYNHSKLKFLFGESAEHFFHCTDFILQPQLFLTPVCLIVAFAIVNLLKLHLQSIQLLLQLFNFLSSFYNEKITKTIKII